MVGLLETRRFAFRHARGVVGVENNLRRVEMREVRVGLEPRRFVFQHDRGVIVPFRVST